MKRPYTIDPFFDRQPEKAFMEDLKKPVHERKPAFFGMRPPEDGEICAAGMYLGNAFPEDQGLLDTSYQDFSRFLSVHEMGGTRYPLRFQ